ncbi:MAG: helix-turn-helix transcriptional regulator [Chitinophagaceae bacterium]|nr:helix-turn-helix transcriptional regulator [Chitinophagaceae bacterium]
MKARAYFRNMNAQDRNTTLLNEYNWSDVVSHIRQFPFRVSEIRQLNKNIQLSQVSFKYNLQGKEIYFNGKKEVILSPGEYLLANNHETCEVSINEAREDDLGVCIDIHTDLLQQAISAFLNPSGLSDEMDKKSFFLEEQLFVRYRSGPLLHQYMWDLFHQIKSGNIGSLQEMECEFIRQLLFHQLPYLKAYQNIPVIRKSTRTELYEKMLQARNHLHDMVYSQISMKELAQSIFLSEFRFFHLFKETFRISPHQYLIGLKLQEAIRLFHTAQYTWTEIAMRLHFADVQSFSKVFKKHYRMSPRAYMNARIG